MLRLISTGKKLSSFVKMHVAQSVSAARDRTSICKSNTREITSFWCRALVGGNEGGRGERLAPRLGLPPGREVKEREGTCLNGPQIEAGYNRGQMGRAL